MMGSLVVLLVIAVTMLGCGVHFLFVNYASSLLLISEHFGLFVGIVLAVGVLAVLWARHLSKPKTLTVKGDNHVS